MVRPLMRFFSQNCQKFFLATRNKWILGGWDGTGAICCSQGIKATDGEHEDKAAMLDFFDYLLNF